MVNCVQDPSWAERIKNCAKNEHLHWRMDGIVGKGGKERSRNETTKIYPAFKGNGGMNLCSLFYHGSSTV